MSRSDVGIGRAVVAQAQEDVAAGRATASAHEHRAWLVAAISLAVTSAEIVGGRWLNSLALTSDGVHSASHAGVMLIAASAYVYVRRDRLSAARAARALDLAAFTSGVLLAVAAVGLGAESLERLLDPQPVHFREAAVVTALGLTVSGASAWILRGSHAGAHAHDSGGGVEHVGHRSGRDLNLWAAYLHMLADVVTSILALAALVAGAFTGWARLDSLVGVLNTAVVAAFAVRLLATAARALGRRA